MRPALQRPLHALATALTAVAAFALAGCHEQPQPTSVDLPAVVTSESALASSRQEEHVEVERVPPTQPAQVFQETATEPRELATWARDASLAVEVRYSALRRLEEEDGQAAVEVALELLQDEAPLVRTNAIALLCRSDDPRAREAVAGLEGRELRLAQALAERNPR